MEFASLNRQIGSILLILGTEMGAGMLALPIVIVHVGVYVGTIILIIAWAIMLYTALLICEAISTTSEYVSFASMAEKSLGKWGKFFMTIVFWCTLSSIAIAYISAAGSTFNHMLSISTTLASTIFVVLFGIFVILGTKTVDYINRIFLGLTLIAFFISILMLFTGLKTVYLSTHGEYITIIYSFPVIITAFILHNLIPSIHTYLNYDKKVLRRVVIIGSLIPLVLYILWVTATIGNIPEHGPYGFDLLFAVGNKANVGALLDLLSLNTHNNLIITSVNIVAIMTVISAFLGTSISLYHFIRDSFGHVRKNIVTHFVIPVIMTFIIPLFIVITYPNIFIIALSYAGVGATILFVLIPIIITKKLIKTGHVFSISILHNHFLLNLVFLIGLGVISIQMI